MFWPYVKKHIPATRLFYCDPPGSTDAESLMNFGNQLSDNNFIYCHDQEPVYSDLHQSLFSAVHIRNLDLNYTTGARHSAMIVSELHSDQVDQVCDQYGWTPYYYFFHGWAALDWFRGYNRTSLIKPIQDRNIKYSFISPNRIVGGRRDHRVLLMYHCLKHCINSALISFPKTCPYENVDVIAIADRYTDVYPDIVDVLNSAALPRNMPNEIGHPMHSYTLSLVEENYSSLIHVVTETSYYGHKWHLTEKSFKPICLQMPFVLVSNAGSLEYLKQYGFKTFDSVWDESYDVETDDHVRLEKIAALLKSFDSMTAAERTQTAQACKHIVEHNFQHFYGGNFEHVLWQEFTTMMQLLESNCNRI